MGRAEEALGSLDILVNNAGITRDGLAVRMKDEDWDRVLAVNLTSAFALSRAALKGMMKRRTRPHRRHHLRRRKSPAMRARRITRPPRPA